jgi:ABC-type dipeptide/oligopeptide/nickel transport system permease subunit
MFGAAISLLITLVALAAPLLAPYDPIQVQPDKIFEARSWSHWLGTDELGRDLFSRLIYGARISFFIGLVAVAFKTVVAAPSGSLPAILRRRRPGSCGCWTCSTRFPDPAGV